MSLSDVPALASVTSQLARVASGKARPDAVIEGGRLLSVYSKRLLPDRELWLSAGRVACARRNGEVRSQGLDTVYHDAEDGIVAPALVDPHAHIESSMMTACSYAEAALLSGVATLFCDSHEIANVAGAEGVEWMLQDARQAPLNIYLTVPSAVPATSMELETAGGDMTPERVAAIFDRWPEAVALGEKMDFPQVCQGDPRAHAIIAAALERGRPVCGHVYGREYVPAYAASGVTDTHEAIDQAIAEDLLDAGLWLFLRGGPPTTPWHSLPEAIKCVTEAGADPGRVCVCTDDRDPDDLFAYGLDWVVRQAVAAGLPFETAWSLGTLHPATRYGLDGELGGLGGGRRADIVLLDDDLQPRSVWLAGRLVAREGRIEPILEKALGEERYAYPQAAYRTVRLPKRPHLAPELPSQPCAVNVLRVEEPGIVTLRRRLELDAPPKSWDALFRESSLCFIAVVERHGRNGGVGRGLLQNFGLEEGAVASSVGHDAHNVIVAGASESDMLLALRRVEEAGGGVVAVRDGSVLAQIELPIAGLLSDKGASAVAEETRALKRAWEGLGCRLPYMGFNLLSLSVIPELRLTDKGLVAVPEMALTPLFEPLAG